MKGETRPCGLTLSKNSLEFQPSAPGLPPKEMTEPQNSQSVDLSVSINLNVLHIKGGKKVIVADVIGFPIMLRTILNSYVMIIILRFLSTKSFLFLLPP